MRFHGLVYVGQSKADSARAFLRPTWKQKSVKSDKNYPNGAILFSNACQWSGVDLIQGLPRPRGRSDLRQINPSREEGIMRALGIVVSVKRLAGLSVKGYAERVGELSTQPEVL